MGNASFPNRVIGRFGLSRISVRVSGADRHNFPDTDNQTMDIVKDRLPGLRVEHH
jgi:hypothetical protein